MSKTKPDLFADQEVFKAYCQVPYNYSNKAGKDSKIAKTCKTTVSERLYSQKKVVDYQKWKKNMSWNCLEYEFRPSINRPTQDRKKLETVFEQNRLSKQHNARVLAHQVYDHEAKECTLKPQINPFSRKKKLPIHLSLYKIPDKELKTEPGTCKGKKRSCKAFLNRMEEAKARHDKEIEDLRQSVHSNTDKQTGQPLFSPCINNGYSEKVKYVKVFQVLETKSDRVIAPNCLNINTVDHKTTPISVKSK